MTSCGLASSSAEGRRASPSALTSPGTPADTTPVPLPRPGHDFSAAKLRQVAAALEQPLDRLPEAVEVGLTAAATPPTRLLGEQLGARHVHEIDALGHQEQVFLAGTVLAQRVEVPLDVAHRAEVNRAF